MKRNIRIRGRVVRSDGRGHPARQKGVCFGDNYIVGNGPSSAPLGNVQKQ